MAYKIENNPLFSGSQENKEETAQPVKRGKGRPKKDDVVRGNSVQEGLTAEYTRATFIVRVDLLEELKDYAYTERKELKTVINELLEADLTRIKKMYTKQGKELLKREKESK